MLLGENLLAMCIWDIFLGMLQYVRRRQCLFGPHEICSARGGNVSGVWNRGQVKTFEKWGSSENDDTLNVFCPQTKCLVMDCQTRSAPTIMHAVIITYTTLTEMGIHLTF